MSERPRLLYVVTHGISARLLLRGQLKQMQEWGFDVSVAASPGPDLETVREREGVTAYPIPMEREIAPKDDAIALLKLVRLMRRVRPHIVNASTPKGGLLGMIAARVTNVPVRIYLLRGLRLETATGVTRAVLGQTERLASACAHRVIAVSPSLHRLYVEGGYAPAKKVSVLGAGASNGVDVDRFQRTPERRAQSVELRQKLGLPEDAFVVGFVGRYVADKGIGDLLDAFDDLRQRQPKSRLLLVGGDLAGDALATILGERIRRTEGVVDTGPVSDVAPYYGLMHVLAFPSRREGFPNVPLEAAAAEVPAVGYQVTGVRDVVAHGETGLLLPAGDARALADALARYAQDRALLGAHSRASSERVARLFSNGAVWGAWREEYVWLLEETGLPLPLSGAEVPAQPAARASRGQQGPS